MKEWICEEVPALAMDGKVVSTMLHQEQELVRCKDCKYNDDGECIIKAGWFPVKPDWFCADGERRTDDA